jgi:hypothetical protein
MRGGGFGRAKTRLRKAYVAANLNASYDADRAAPKRSDGGSRRAMMHHLQTLYRAGFEPFFRVG